VNWIRWNCPPIAAASDFTASVLASPGTPSTSRWPPASRPIAIRSSRTSWPTIVRLTSNSTCSSGWVMLPPELPMSGGRRPCLRPGHVCGPRCAAGPPPSAVPIGTANAMPAKASSAGVGDGQHDPDDVAVRVQQRPAGAARVDRRVELDQPGEPPPLVVAGAATAETTPEETL
jgi:hypothetical protein